MSGRCARIAPTGSQAQQGKLLPPSTRDCARPATGDNVVLMSTLRVRPALFAPASFAPAYFAKVVIAAAVALAIVASSGQARADDDALPITVVAVKSDDALDQAEALTQALVVSGFGGEMEEAGAIGIEMLKAEILQWHKAGHEAGVDCPEVEITKVWKKLIDSLRKTETLSAKEPDIEQIRRLALEYECRVNPVFPMPGRREIIRKIRDRGRMLGIVSNAQF